MALSLLFKKTKGSVGLVEFDATLSETHNKSVQLTDHPVEAGADITDHVRRQPEEISINGIVSNTPIVFLASIFAASPIKDDLTRPSDRAGLAYAELKRLMDDGEVVDVITTLREYENMVITSMSVERSAATGNVLNASLSLREIVLVETETVEAPQPVTKANEKSKPVGKQVTTPAPPPVEAKSSALVTGLSALFG